MEPIKNYVEEVWIDKFIESYIKEIKSIKDYLLNNTFDSCLQGFRFFQTEQKIIDGKVFTSEPENYTEWISNNKYDNYDRVIVNNEEIKWSDCTNLQEFISKLDSNTTLDIKKQYTKKIK